MDAATLELLGLHEAGWWAFVESVKAALGLMALALGGFSLLAVALAVFEWAGHRRAARVSSAVAPVAAALVHADTVVMPRPARRRARVRARSLVHHLASRVACPVRVATYRDRRPESPGALPIHEVAGAGSW